MTDKKNFSVTNAVVTKTARYPLYGKDGRAAETIPVAHLRTEDGRSCFATLSSEGERRVRAGMNVVVQVGQPN